MIEMIPNDNHYLVITALLTICMQLFFFFIAYSCQFDTLTDLAGSANFILIALLTFYGSGYFYTRQTIVTVLVVISKIYLACYLFTRVLKRGHDARFDSIRNNFYAFLGFWIFQMLWAWVVSLSVTFINADSVNPKLGTTDYVGIVMFVVGLLFEVIGDLQKDAFRSDSANRKVSDSVYVISKDAT